MDPWSYVINLTITCAVWMLFGLALEHGLLDRFNFFRNLKMAISTVFRTANIFIDSYTRKHTVNVVRTRSGKAMSISYSTGGRPAILHVPYNNSHFLKMKEWKVYLAYENRRKSSLEITQEYGIPYLCTADMLGGDRILAVHKVTGEVMVFDRNIVPNFNLD
jgi:hypothetical protein